MAKLELPLLARASVALLLLLCLFFVIVGISTSYWGILTIDYLSLPAASQELYYLGVWLPFDQTTLGYLNAHQQAAKAFAVFSLLGSALISALFISMAFAPKRWLPDKLAQHLPMCTLIATAVTCLVQLILWSVMAGLYNRWRSALEARAAATASAVQSYGLLGFSFALVLMANIGQLAAMPAVYAVVKLEAATASSSRAPTSTPATAASTTAATTTRIDQLAAAAAGSGGGSGNVRFHRTRPAPPLPPPSPPLPPPPPLPQGELSPMPIRVRVQTSSASPVAATTDIDAEVNSTGVDNHSVENEEMLERLHQHTASCTLSAEPAADEV